MRHSTVYCLFYYYHDSFLADRSTISRFFVTVLHALRLLGVPVVVPWLQSYSTVALNESTSRFDKEVSYNEEMIVILFFTLQFR